MGESFKGIFRGKKILITGDTGFKGSWLSIWLHELGANVYGYALPAKAKTDNFVLSGLTNRIVHEDGDIRDYHKLYAFAKKVNPEIVFHLAAQSLVLYSYENPKETFETNLLGTVNFLEVVRNLGSVRVAINITSDKCYENQSWVWGYRENDPMGGSDPYSSSKGCSELITSSYLNSFFQNENTTHIASARAGNVIGGGDWASNRIVPDFFRAYLEKTNLTIRNPYHTRPWQHVLEPLSGYLQLASMLYLKGKTYSGGWNFGPLDSNHYSVEFLIKSIIENFGAGNFSVPKTIDKPHEAHLLKLDISKSMKMLEWKPVLDFFETVAFTVAGYGAEIAGKEIYKERVAQIREYINLANNKRIPWAI